MMARAATRRCFDFERFDPRDRWHWKKLRWILEELDAENAIAAVEAQHRHWITTFANASLDDDSFGASRDNAKLLMQQLLIARFPWDREKYENQKLGTADEAIEEFRESYGYPGDPEYEAMLEKMLEQLDKLDNLVEEE